MLDSASPFAAAMPPGAETMNALAYRRLRRAVVGLELAPGSLAGEAELAERFRLGRASVRVALTRLSVAGLVEAQPRHGWRIAPVTGALVGEVAAARRALEPSLAQVRPSAKEADRLATLIAMNQALREQDGPALVTARVNDRLLLDLLAARLDRLRARWLGEAWDHAERIGLVLDGSGTPWRPPERDRLVAALLARDEAAARHEIEAAIAAFEVHAGRAILALPVPIMLPGQARAARANRPGRVIPRSRQQTQKVTS